MSPVIPTLTDYRSLIALDESIPAPTPLAPEEAQRLIRGVLDRLIEGERAPWLARLLASLSRLSDRDALRALLTARPAHPFLSPDVHGLLDRLLAFERQQRPCVEALDLPPAGSSEASVLALWQGDITTLRIDAIVNAANDALLGCFQPFHRCIDNAIHAAAGPRLREDCARLMDLQGFPEPTGHAKITRAYHLPADYVLHTVGPIYGGEGDEPGNRDQQALASSYRSCLDLAAELPDIRSLAFPCISTGVFGFPAKPATQVAVATVSAWLDQHPGRFDRVVFNVFLDSDRALYHERLAELRPHA
jgi:O-acetyl-ADP-ribose deacetylase (regulator of RNase III)